MILAEGAEAAGRNSRSSPFWPKGSALSIAEKGKDKKRVAEKER